MGAETLQALGMSHQVLGGAEAELTSSADTRNAAQALCDAGVDLILFAGGDGTARDIFDVVGGSFPVLGIPAGVKMHSGVFAVSPEAAGDRFYGDMLVPGEGRYLQHTKVGGRESPELVADDIADWLAEHMEAGRTYLIGPGSTTAAIMARLNLANTLLGVDVVRDSTLLESDADEETLLAQLSAAPGGASIVVTIIGGQGNLFGRGNQQFSPEVIRAVGLDNIVIVAAKSKIAALEGRPLLVDTNDPELDRALCGWRSVITGYEDRILYRVAAITE
jgi:predicted polyphosphate/ATP-dependent NAD kinase